MATAIAIPVLTIAVVLQTTVLSRVTLLQGPADLVLLILASWSLADRVQGAWFWAAIAGLLVGWVSSLPIWLPPLTYFAVTGFALLLRKRVWQIPILALFTSAFFGTLVIHGAAILVLTLGGIAIDFSQAFNLVILPSLLLNILLAIPVNGVISEIAQWVYPAEPAT